MRVFLTGGAALWFDSLTDAIANDFQQLQAAFDQRYKTPKIMQFISAKEVFTRCQADDESVEEYCSLMGKLARDIEADDKLIQYAILNGLKAPIAAYVTQQKPDTLDKMLEAARVAELTIPSSSPADSNLTQQLSAVQDEVKCLSGKWDKLVTAPIFDRRSPSPPARRVTFAPPPRPERPMMQRPTTPGMRPSFYARSGNERNGFGQ